MPVSGNCLKSTSKSTEPGHYINNIVVYIVWNWTCLYIPLMIMMMMILRPVVRPGTDCLLLLLGQPLQKA